MKNIFRIILLLLPSCFVNAQVTDTTQLPEVQIVSWFAERPLLRTPASVAILDSNQLGQHHGQSIVPAMNMLAGVRMEERSPGSYRLSIRGSLLRSPFGVRNVKVYADEFPLTDAGGNTYLNLIDPLAIKRIEVLKGPDGSLFGANSGGVVHLHLTQPDSAYAVTGVTLGSYGLLRSIVRSQTHWRKHRFEFVNGTHQGFGYRENSQLQRRYMQIADEWKYTDGFGLKVLFFFSDLNYGTPGGLTAAQAALDPRDARPGAVQQQTGVRNQTYFAGIHHTARLFGNIEHHFLISGNLTAFRNPFLSNIELRREKGGAIRTWFNTTNESNGDFGWNVWLGFEGQKTISQIDNYRNVNGTRDALLDADDLEAVNYFGFARTVLDIASDVMVEAAVSLNFSSLVFQSYYPAAIPETRRKFAPQLMPKLSASWQFFRNMVLRAQVARGYSPPTIAEVRSSDNVINTSLQPEHGWNYEIGVRMIDEEEIIWWEFSAFYFRLEQAIVRSTDEAGVESFNNTGSTDQPGFENSVIFHVIRNKEEGFFRDLILSNSYTYYAFRFSDYKVDSVSFSGNKLTGVPTHVVATSAQLAVPFGFSFYVQHQYVSAVPLDDANSVFSDDYNLVQARVNWKYSFRRFALQLFTGVDNILDERYSLGNDLNAAGGRYFNPAPARNYYGGFNVIF